MNLGIDGERIKWAMQSGFMKPSRAALKRMMNAGKWEAIGRLFDFTPRFIQMLDGKEIIDWSCIPEQMSSILRSESGRINSKFNRLKSPRSRGRHNSAALKTHEIQNGFCYYCKKPTIMAKWSVDHKIPRCRGGSNLSENKVGCCKTCNQSKANMTEAEFLLTPPNRRKEMIRGIQVILAQPDYCQTP